MDEGWVGADYMEPEVTAGAAADGRLRRPMVSSLGRPALRFPLPLAVLVGVAVVGSAAVALLLVYRHAVIAALAAAPVVAVRVAVRLGRTAPAPRLVFAERLIGRALEAALLLPVAWHARVGEPRSAVLALVALASLYVATYEEAKATSLGYRSRDTFVIEVLALVLLLLGLLSGLVEAALWVVAAIGVAAVVRRAADVADEEREARSAPP